MSAMIIRNGYIFDPLNEIDGEILDIFISDGKIVEGHHRRLKTLKSSTPKERR